jgi:peptidoglycan hydrolase-like protein with peptidoglycan-binding domain
MNNESKKMLIAVVCLLVISALGFNTVYGYGSRGGGGERFAREREAQRQEQQQQQEQGAVLGAATFAFNMDLRQGMANNDVRELQERLRALGFFTFHTSTGYFGPITRAALARYQAANGIVPAVGYFGPITRASLNL